jgi:kinesin family protein 2/24
MLKKEAEIEGMTPEAVLIELKNKSLQVFGTLGERKERLKKHYGVPLTAPLNANASQKSEINPPVVVETPKLGKKSGVVEKIEEMKQKRDVRRKKMEEDKKHKLEKEAENMAIGKTGDVDFEMMMEKCRLSADNMKPHLSPEAIKINVCVRKRPLFEKEMQAGEIDCVSVANPRLLVHECKFKVDGITKYLDNHEFNFDNVSTF